MVQSSDLATLRAAFEQALSQAASAADLNGVRERFLGRKAGLLTEQLKALGRITDVDERRRMLARLIDVEHRVWLEVEGHDRVFAVADEDLERGNDEKTSSVHFLRFEFDAPMRAALKAGAALSVGIDHPAATHACTVDDTTRAALTADLD